MKIHKFYGIRFSFVIVLVKEDHTMSDNQDDRIWNNYIQSRTNLYRRLLPANVNSSMISEANWMIRSRYASGEQMGITVSKGDICYLDYGQTYLNEAGFQHFGLTLAVYERKALIIPMTSNKITYEKAYDPVESPHGRKHLMRLGQIRGMNKPSVLFLNDARFINTARVIDIKAHISRRSKTFRDVQERLKEIIF